MVLDQNYLLQNMRVMNYKLSLLSIAIIFCSGSGSEARQQNSNQPKPNYSRQPQNYDCLHTEIECMDKTRRYTRKDPSERGNGLAFGFPSAFNKAASSYFNSGNGWQRKCGTAASNPAPVRKAAFNRVLMAGTADKGAGKRRGRVVRYQACSSPSGAHR